MKLIIESGSSKTDYAVVCDGATIMQDQVAGMNPALDRSYRAILKALLNRVKTEINISSIHYYGAGCVSEVINGEVKKVITALMETGEVYIADDLLGACRAVAADYKSLVCILGTGSNIGYFDGLHVADRVRSGGYLLGDEGSGYRIGQAIYRMWIRGDLPGAAAQSLMNTLLSPNTDPVLHLYEQENPRTYLARFASSFEFLHASAQAEITHMVFGELIQNMILPLYRKYSVPISFVGSIAFYFEKWLSPLLKEQNITVRSIVKSPIEGLVQFHS